MFAFGKECQESVKAKRNCLYCFGLQAVKPNLLGLGYKFLRILFKFYGKL